jgi:hypothetical protein
MIARFPSSSRSSSSSSSSSSLGFARFARRRKTTRRFPRGEDNRTQKSGNDASSPRAQLVDEEESSSSSSSSSSSEKERRRLKDALVEACRGTYRGALFASNERETKAIFDAKARLEKSFLQRRQKSKEGESEFDDFDDALLDGRWKLIFTTALDVTGLLVLSIPPPPVPFFPPPPVVVGDIFQEFKTETKEIVNEIRVSVPLLLEEKDGVILRVNATYKEAKSSNSSSSNDNSKRALELVFQEAVVSDVRISEFTEMLLAPAVLPRTELNQRVLLFLRDFEVRFPLFGRAARAMGGGTESTNENERTPGAAVGRYEFSYCDEDVLIGKATGSNGIFIFTKDHRS